jgi:hypothetical protein
MVDLYKLPSMLKLYQKYYVRMYTVQCTEVVFISGAQMCENSEYYMYYFGLDETFIGSRERFCTDKKEKKIFLIYKEFRWDRVQSHI